jgi:hypothetical protein
VLCALPWPVSHCHGKTGFWHEETCFFIKETSCNLFFSSGLTGRVDYNDCMRIRETSITKGKPKKKIGNLHADNRFFFIATAG